MLHVYNLVQTARTSTLDVSESDDINAFSTVDLDVSFTFFVSFLAFDDFSSSVLPPSLVGYVNRRY